MKILYLTDLFPTLENKTAGSYIYKRIEYLIKNNIDIKVIIINSLITKRRPFNYLRNYNLNNIGFQNDLEVTVFNRFVINRLYYNLGITGSKIINQVKKYSLKNKIDIVHAHFVWNGMIAYKLNKQFGIPYIVTAHGSDIHTYPYKIITYKNNMMKVLENASKVIFVSNYLLKKAMDFGYSGSNATVIYNGFDGKIFKIKNDKKKNNQRIIGFVGNLEPIKRTDRLPEIFHYIYKNNQDIKFVIIGSGKLKRKIENKLKRFDILNKVIFTGNIPDKEVAMYMNKMDVLILPSRNEGFGIVCLEAQACGVSVVGTDNGGIPEAIEDGGILVPEGDNFEKRFADAVIKLLNHPLDELLLLKRSENFHWNKIIKKDIEVYKSVLKK